MPDADPPNSKPDEIPEPSELGGLDPGELLARGLNTVKPSGGAGAWEPPTPEELSRLLPQYRIERLIGRGGMGAVYKGTQVILDRPVAIKLLPVEVAADEQFIARFHREARTLAKLQHSRIITIHDFGQTSEGHLYFVMEYIDGTNLREILRGPGLNPDQALLVVGQICDALHAAHSQGVIHRDIKPENILVTKDGYVKLADFGLARPLQQEDAMALTGTNVIMGTADYMAPEQREGQTDERADIFSLGVMLYEMLTGKPPRGAFEPASSRCRGLRLDVRIDQVVLKALQAEPERRYQHVSEMKTDVDRIRNTPLPAPPLPKPPRPLVVSSGDRRKTFAFAGAILVLVMGLMTFFLFLKRGRLVPSTSPSSTESAPPSAAADSTQKVAIGEGQERNIFNGKDLTGWIGSAELWSVEDGAITGKKTKENPTNYAALIWNGGHVSDFQLTCKFKIVATAENANTEAGIQFRGWLPEADHYTVGGYLAEMNQDHAKTGDLMENQFGRMFFVRTGQKAIVEDGDNPKRPTTRVTSFTGDANQLRAAMTKDGWNEYKIIAVGNHIQLFVNGRQTVDAVDERSNISKSGFLAFQFHFVSLSKIQFKDITLKDLSGSSVLAQSTSSGPRSPTAPIPVKTALATNTPTAHAPSPEPARSGSPVVTPVTGAPVRGPERDLFNGKDLTGWAGRPEFWSVEDGAITGKIANSNPVGMDVTSLVWRGGLVSDFEFRCKFKIVSNDGKSPVSSGIQFRSELVNPNYFVVKGYKADMAAYMAGTGSLFDQKRRIGLASKGQRVLIKDGLDPMKPDIQLISQFGDAEKMGMLMKQGWNDYRIVAIGNHVQLFLNDIQTVDAVEETSNLATSGILAFDLGAKSEMTVQFKDIKLTELSGSSAAAGAILPTPQVTPAPLVVAKLPLPSASPTLNASANPSHAAASGPTTVEQALTQYLWDWRDSKDGGIRAVCRFMPDGTIKNPHGQLLFHWTVTGSRTFTLSVGNVSGDYTFSQNLTRFEGVLPRDKNPVVGTRMGLVSEEASDSVGPSTITANAPAAPLALPNPAAKQTFGSFQEEALLGYTWSWEGTKNKGSYPVIQFLQDGRVSAGWHWQWLPKPGGELLVDCFWGQDQHRYLKFNKQFSEFEIYGGDGSLAVRGTRLTPVGQNVAVPAAPAGNGVTTLPPATAAVRPTSGVTPPPTNFPATMGARAGEDARAQALMRNGGTKESEEAVLRGLRWLVKNQNPDGSWGPGYKGAMTGFALLSFLGHGETPVSPEFGEAVQKALGWLTQNGAKNEGRLSMNKAFNQSGVYEHAIAAFALGEYYTMTRDERVADLLKRAVGYIVDGQSSDGGWGYGYTKQGDGDTSVTGWQIQALKAAYLTGLEIPGVDQALDKAMLDLKRVQGPKGGFGYRTPGDGYSLAGAGVLGAYLWKQKKDESVRNGIQFIMAQTDKEYPIQYQGEKANLYAWYYDTLACFMFGGTTWQKWNRLFQSEITRSQAPDGSWPAMKAKGVADIQGNPTGIGPFYRTNLCILMLEVYYRYMPEMKGS